MARGTSSDSEDSILSHITVIERAASPTPPRAAADMAADARSSVGASSLQSTPPTSLDGSTGDLDAPKGGSKRRVSRARSSLSTLADGETASTKRKASRSKEEPESKTTSRAVSGATLVEGNSSNEARDKLKKELDIDMHWDMADDEPATSSKDGLKRRASRRSQIGLLAGEATSALAASTSSLGKRARDAIESVKDKATTRTTRANAPQSPPKRVKTEETGPRRIFPNLKRSEPKKEEKQEEVAAPQEPEKPKREPRVQKLYQNKGLYAGQPREFNPAVKEATNKKKKQSEPAHVIEKENSVLPLPMFGAYLRLTVDDDRFAPYKLPADVLRPLPKEQNPKDWSKLNRSRHIKHRKITCSDHI